MYDECDRIGVERPRYFNTDNFVRIVFKRPDLSKWTHDGFVNDTLATENGTVEENKDIRRDISKNISHEAVDAKTLKLINAIGDNWVSASTLMKILGFTSQPTFNRNYLKPALNTGLIILERPDSRNSPNQKYGLSDKAKAIYYSTKSKDNNSEDKSGI